MPHRVFLPDWFWVIVLVATVVGTCWTDSPWFFAGLFILLMAQGIYVFHVVRCPTCGGGLKFHREDIPYTTRYRFQLACPHCQVVWGTGKISDDRTD